MIAPLTFDRKALTLGLMLGWQQVPICAGLRPVMLGVSKAALMIRNLRRGQHNREHNRSNHSTGHVRSTDDLAKGLI